jgi:hypothetical protein
MPGNGKIIGPKNTGTSNSGLWTPQDFYFSVKQKKWPLDIVQSSLVLNYDLTNLDCYPGTGTTIYDLSNSKLNASGSVSLSGQTIQNGQTYSTGTTGILNLDTHSIFFSIQINNTSGSWDKIFSYNAGGIDRSPGIWRYPGERKIHWRYDPSNSDSDFSATGTSGYSSTGSEFSINTWYYVGLTKNGGTTIPYVNGSSLGTRTGVSNPKTAGTAAVILYEYFSGASKMRHVHIYNRVLSAEEVALNYKAISNSL